jgi:hypothetical protein
VPRFMSFTLTSGRNLRLTISTTSTARFIAIPLAFFVKGARIILCNQLIAQRLVITIATRTPPQS